MSSVINNYGCYGVWAGGVTPRPALTTTLFPNWDRICKRLMRPGIDSEDSIPPAYVVWRAGTTNRVIVPTRQAENRFLGSIKGLQIRALVCCCFLQRRRNRYSPPPCFLHVMYCRLFALSLMSLLSLRTKATGVKRAPQTGPWRETKPGSRDGGQGQEAHRHCSGLHTAHCTAQVCAIMPIITYHNSTVLPPHPKAQLFSAYLCSLKMQQLCPENVGNNHYNGEETFQQKNLCANL